MTFDIASTSLGIAFLSLSIAFYSCIISYESDEKMNVNSNAQFLSVISKFEDRRIDVVFHEIPLHVGLWKALVDMGEAVELNKSENINQEHLKTLADRYNGLMDLVIIPAIYEIWCEDIRHVLKMYKYVLDLNIPEGLKAESEGYIKELFGLNDDVEIHVEYVDILLNNIPDSIRWNNYLQHRLDIIG